MLRMLRVGIRHAVWMMALCGVLLWAQDKGSNGSKSQDQPKQSQSGGAAPAAGKKESEPKRVTGSDGKTYIVRETPFGVVKVPETPAKAEKDDENEPPPDLKVREVGDSIEFQRMTPFVPVKWTKKKTELNELERRAWEREQRRAEEAAKKSKKEDQ
ncbi:MAG: hypothetical protein K6T61_03490 [Bryobacteraceae bacterium]|nr:hypothetical protein [Bryobacteraceae bacterium]